ncbi:hypothetical protein [Cellulosimicrobium sp. SH8]|uniref:hypothetical protein n=1 Tax=Cellulosimicrobium sp. SH8 TaxID=2952936 RepID=UPI0021F284F1|nr:hypothetical protein [Cellulosimicrobium sp. SH8]
MNESSRLLRDAWNLSTGDEGLDQLLQMSLAAHASDAPEQVETLRALQLAGRSQLDLHVEGERESAHETSAQSLGQFLIRVSDAVRAVAKSVSGMQRIWGDVNVLAPSQGSVRVIFVEQHDRVVEGVRRRSDAAWANGLEMVASTFELADEGRDELDAALLDLDLPSRRALRLLGQTVEENDWGLAGSLTTRSGATRDVRLSSSAARRLIDATGSTPARTYPKVVPGVVDAWRWSTSTMRLSPDAGAAIEAFVPRDLQLAVADANAHPGRRVDATFEVVETLGGGRSGNMKRVFTLQRLDVLPTLMDGVEQEGTEQ